MRLFRFFLILVSLAGTAFAQTEERGSIPPGQSQDGSGPSDGALKGGAILPGEQAGVPESGKVQSRCEELTGSLREECLRQERSGSTGGTAGTPATQRPPSPPVTTPPQNPR